MIRNSISRSWLNGQYERFIFQHKNSDLKFYDPDNIATTRLAFSAQNIKKALLASGSIPMVMQGIKDIPDCPQGMYRDGGIIDYHFDFEIQNQGLTLYPHFNAQPKAGWFDKKLARTVRAKNYHNTVLICPSQQFIDSLPYGKIPDRTDFTEMPAEQRIKYWRQVFSESEKLAAEFKAFVAAPDVTKIKPISAIASI